MPFHEKSIGRFRDFEVIKDADFLKFAQGLQSTLDIEPDSEVCKTYPWALGILDPYFKSLFGKNPILVRANRGIYVRSIGPEAIVSTEAFTNFTGLGILDSVRWIMSEDDDLRDLTLAFGRLNLLKPPSDFPDLYHIQDPLVVPVKDITCILRAA